MRCINYRKDFKPSNNSQFHLTAISYSKWLALTKLFELSLSAKTALEQIQLNYKATLKVFDPTIFDTEKI